MFMTLASVLRRPRFNALPRKTFGSVDVAAGGQEEIDCVPEGDELRDFADRQFITKPELADALTGLRKLEEQAQQHFSRACLRTSFPARILLSPMPSL